MTATLLVHKPGLHTTIQDLGRHGLQSMGVPVSGALDSTALRIANHLVGNEPTTAALEVLGSGPDLEVKTESVRIAIAGGDARIERLSPNPGRFRTFESFCLQRGDLIRIGAVTDMAMTYLAVEGGFDLPLAMGSFSTYTRGAFGGFKGRALKTDDELSLVLPAAPDRDESRFAERALPGELPIRIIPGPQDDYFSPQHYRHWSATNTPSPPPSTAWVCAFKALHWNMRVASTSLLTARHPVQSRYPVMVCRSSSSRTGRPPVVTPRSVA